jgi:hypothetical protein
MPPRKPRQSKKSVQQEEKVVPSTLSEKVSEKVSEKNDTEEEVKVSTNFFDVFNLNPVVQTTTTQLQTEAEDIVKEVEISDEVKLVHEVNQNIELQRAYTIPDNVITDSSQQVNPTQFYLYYDLEKQAIQMMGSRTRLEVKELETFNRVIKDLDTEGMRICFVIIRMYALKQKTGKIFDLPYHGKIIKEYQNLFDIEFDLKNLPGILQKMLLIFTEKHIDNLNISSLRQDEDAFIRKKF